MKCKRCLDLFFYPQEYKNVIIVNNINQLSTLLSTLSKITNRFNVPAARSSNILIYNDLNKNPRFIFNCK